MCVTLPRLKQDVDTCCSDSQAASPLLSEGVAIAPDSALESSMTGLFTSMLYNLGYQLCAGQAGAIRHADVIASAWILAKALPIKLKGGKRYGCLNDQGMEKASTLLPAGSSFQLQLSSSWWLVWLTSRSTLKGPKDSWKDLNTEGTVGAASRCCRENGKTPNWLGYSPCLESALHGKTLCAPNTNPRVLVISGPMQIKSALSSCLCERFQPRINTDTLVLFFKKLCIANRAAFNSRTLMWSSVSEAVHSPPVLLPWQTAPHLDASDSITTVAFGFRIGVEQLPCRWSLHHWKLATAFVDNWLWPDRTCAGAGRWFSGVAMLESKVGLCWLLV